MRRRRRRRYCNAPVVDFSPHVQQRDQTRLCLCAAVRYAMLFEHIYVQVGATSCAEPRTASPARCSVRILVPLALALSISLSLCALVGPERHSMWAFFSMRTHERIARITHTHTHTSVRAQRNVRKHCGLCPWVRACERERVRARSALLHENAALSGFASSYTNQAYNYRFQNPQQSERFSTRSHTHTSSPSPALTRALHRFR